MNRRTRRARRRLRRGDARREPLLLIADDRPDLIEWIELAARVGYRYRSELAPFALAGALLLAARDPARTTSVAPWWVAAGRACRSRAGCAGRGSRRCCARSNAATPSPSCCSGGVAHRRRRTTARTRRRCRCCCWSARSSAGSRGGPTDAAAPRSASNAPSTPGRDITAAVGMPGSRVMSAVVDRWGWRARIGLPPGTTATDLINSTPALESGLAPDPARCGSSPTPTAPTTPPSAS